MVEAAGIEPASERSSAESPTSVSDLLWNVLARVAPIGGISARQPYCVSSSALGRGFGPACVCMAPGSVPHRRGPVRRHRLLLGGESHLLVGRCTVPTFLTRRESPACTLWFSPPVETCTPPVGRVVDRAPRSPVPMRYRPPRLRTGCRRRGRRSRICRQGLCRPQGPKREVPGLRRHPCRHRPHRRLRGHRATAFRWR